jgi:methionyl aminopeptidase
MVYYKTDEEIEIIRECCLLVSRTLAEVAKVIKEGVSTIYLDKIAEEFIRDNNAVPGFLGYGGFPNTLCISVNEEVVHGIPSEKVIKDGDIVSVDCGVKKFDFYGDSAYTFAIGEVTTQKSALLKATKESLYKGIELAVEGNRLGDVSNAIQQHVQSRGYSVVREMVGHGLGHDLHEDPQVPNYGKKGSGLLLKSGLVIAIEPMINLGRKEIRIAKNEWTVSTVDKKPSAHYEHTIAVRKNSADILSTFEYIEEVLNQK